MTKLSDAQVAELHRLRDMPAEELLDSYDANVESMPDGRETRMLRREVLLRCMVAPVCAKAIVQQMEYEKAR